jgi:hypothetical protein
MEIVTERVSVTTTGAAGSAAGSGDTPSMIGELLDIYLDFHASAPATTDVTISFKDRGGNVWAASNVNTGVLVHPRAKPVDNANAAIADAHARFALSGALTVTLAQCDALTNAVVAYIRYLRY